jgi:hypothetical protein
VFVIQNSALQNQIWVSPELVLNSLQTPTGLYGVPNLTYLSSNYTTLSAFNSFTGSVSELAQDAVGNIMTGVSGMNVVYNDAANSITLKYTGYSNDIVKTQSRTGVAVNLSGNNYATLVSGVIQNVSIGDMIQFNLKGTYLQNCGVTITPRTRFRLNDWQTIVLDGTTVASSATNRTVYTMSADFSIIGANSGLCIGEIHRYAPAAVNTASSIALTTSRGTWNITSTGYVGTVTGFIDFQGQHTGNTQTFNVISSSFTKLPNLY